MLASSYQKKLIEAGCDEAGRGCLAGPVYAAAVILPIDYKNSLLNDSKKLSEKNRNQLRIEIEKDAIAFGIGIVDNEKIDEINILKASFLAMHLAVQQLNTAPELLLIDGNRFTPYPSIPHKCIIKGDAKFLSIAAASVLAKTYRDEFLEKMHQEFPVYDWSKNKAYPTKKHRESIIKYGITSYHRKSFNLFPRQQRLDLEF
ncbi:MAG: ribonuclease HII [Flavobacteriales bacterium]|nr:ribonuclease HII [Flavobacteriales bacterium]MCW8912251.1 ribonuclease HII [Flavobacteriales bacterium]MCW8937510.1 ribonuclease HII [Flavobacteriales bacterium]MCW8941168.1 ribonuclease HII [Flavobacteriales bacterium]MCW8967165.1 ribonuclease HII [Flavobacteriales bacterium]